MVKMGFRWYGSQDDPIPLKYIRQIPGCEQVVGALFDIPVGEVWPKERIKALKDEVEAAGLKLEVIESVNIHDDIKIGLPTRDQYIENYKQTIRNLAEYGIKVICYNFMPVFRLGPQQICVLSCQTVRLIWLTVMKWSRGHCKKRLIW